MSRPVFYSYGFSARSRGTGLVIAATLAATICTVSMWFVYDITHENIDLASRICLLVIAIGFVGVSFIIAAVFGGVGIHDLIYGGAWRLEVLRDTLTLTIPKKGRPVSVVVPTADIVKFSIILTSFGDSGGSYRYVLVTKETKLDIDEHLINDLVKLVRNLLDASPICTIEVREDKHSTMWPGTFVKINALCEQRGRPLEHNSERWQAFAIDKKGNA